MLNRIYATGALKEFLEARERGTHTAEEMMRLHQAAMAQCAANKARRKASEPTLNQFLGDLDLKQ